jgi:outer membrane protein OmpA-like peptidoglycan-associated protein
VQIAEDLVAEASAQAAACVPPPEAPPAKAPVVVAVAPVPAPVPPTVVTREVYRLISQVVFNFDRHTAKDMRPASVQQLDGLLAKLRSDGLSVDSVRVIGHADRLNGTGKSDYNQQLSERRAATVRAYLVEHGLKAEQIQSDAKGDSQPVEACAAAQAKGQKAVPKLQECLLPNRRVEVQVNASKR